MKLQAIRSQIRFQATLANGPFTPEQNKQLQDVLNQKGSNTDTVEINVGNVNKWNVGSNHGDVPHIGYSMDAITNVNGIENKVDIGVARAIKNLPELTQDERPFVKALEWAKSFVKETAEVI